MQPSLLSGDCILVNKWEVGARWFDWNDVINGKKIHIYRSWGYHSIKRNDILVFNFPYPKAWDSIGFNVSTYYVKRCIGLPGDIISIRNAHFVIRGVTERLGNRKNQNILRDILSDSLMIRESGIVLYGYPNDSTLNWNIRNWGPLWIPCKNKTIHLNKQNLILYNPLAELES